MGPDIQQMFVPYDTFLEKLKYRVAVNLAQYIKNFILKCGL